MCFKKTIEISYWKWSEMVLVHCAYYDIKMGAKKNTKTYSIACLHP